MELLMILGIQAAILVVMATCTGQRLRRNRRIESVLPEKFWRGLSHARAERRLWKFRIGKN